MKNNVMFKRDTMNYLVILGIISLSISIYICRPLFKGAARGFNEASSTLEESVDKTLPKESHSEHSRHNMVREEGIEALLAMVLGPLVPALVLASFIFFALLGVVKLVDSFLGS